MQLVIPKEAKDPSNTIQQNYPLEAKYFKPDQSFLRRIYELGLDVKI